MATKVTPGLITLSTPSASSNDTTPATTAYVTTAVANLADSAPSTLNTLNELAAALGDDANFSTTVTNSIATKLPLAGGTMTGTIASFTSTGIDDNADATAITIDSSERVGIGTTSPAQKLDVNGYIKATRIGAGISPIVPCEVLSTGSTSTALRVLKSGSDDSTQNNLFSVTEISGHGRLSIHDTSQNEDIRFDSNGISHFNGGKVVIGDTASHVDDLLQIETPASGGGHGIQIRRNDSNGDQGIGRIMFGNNNDTDLATVSAITDGQADSARLVFSTQTTSGSSTERMRITSTGLVQMNGATGSFTSPSFPDGILYTYKTDNEPHIENKVNHTNSFGLYKFNNSNGAAGSISMFSTSVSYNTSSDYRLKEDVNYTWDATSKLKQLKPCEFKFKADSDDVVHQGFLAHEVDDIVPTSVFGEKDGEEMQQLDHSKLVPLLVKTIQELEARIETLEG